jgi:hypothetical protein
LYRSIHFIEVRSLHLHQDLLKLSILLLKLIKAEVLFVGIVQIATLINGMLLRGECAFRCIGGAGHFLVDSIPTALLKLDA